MQCAVSPPRVSRELKNKKNKKETKGKKKDDETSLKTLLIPKFLRTQLTRGVVLMVKGKS